MNQRLGALLEVHCVEPRDATPSPPADEKGRSKRVLKAVLLDEANPVLMDAVP